MEERESVISTLISNGFQINWIDQENAEFTYNGSIYHINIPEMSLRKEGHQFNYIQIPAGTEGGFIYLAGNDIVVDGETMHEIIYLLKHG